MSDRTVLPLTPKRPDGISDREWELGETIRLQHAKLMQTAILLDEVADSINQMATIQLQLALQLKQAANSCRKGSGL